MVSYRIKYSFVFVLLAICPLLISGQIEVYRSYEHFRDTSNREIYKSIRKSIFSNKFVLRDFQGNSYKTPYDSIWGYTSEKNILYRVADIYYASFLKVEAISDRIVLYPLRRDETTIIYDMILTDKKILLYFSKTLQDPIFRLNTRNLLENYTLNDDEKLKLEKLREQGRLNKKNPATGVYYIIEDVFN